MDISGVSANGAVAAALAMQEVSTRTESQVALLKKNIDVQKEGALSLIESIPTPPPAPSGNLGQNINIKV